MKNRLILLFYFVFGILIELKWKTIFFLLQKYYRIIHQLNETSSRVRKKQVNNAEQWKPHQQQQ